MSARILLVEDDPRLLELLAELLGKAGYEVLVESRGDAAAERILAERPELVVLDLGLPGRDGLDVCRQVRASYPGRILVLTARSDEVDEIIGLELGADDYLGKPVSPRKLLARVRALLRRPDGESEGVVRNGPLVVDARRRVAEFHGRPLALSTAEFELLLLLANRLGEPISREELYRELRGVEYDGVDRSSDLRVSRLRKQLGDDPKEPRFIKTLHGRGYQLAVVT